MFKKLNVFIMLVLIGLLSSCEMAVLSVPGSNEEYEDAVYSLNGRYMLVDYGNMNIVLNKELGEGVYGIFSDSKGNYYHIFLFKYASSKLSKDGWKFLINDYKNIFSLNYYSFANEGYYYFKNNKLDTYTWWKNNWVVIVQGKDALNFKRHVVSTFLNSK